MSEPVQVYTACQFVKIKKTSKNFIGIVSKIGIINRYYS